jgi:hypothetical protein
MILIYGELNTVLHNQIQWSFSLNKTRLNLIPSEHYLRARAKNKDGAPRCEM